jgi:intracellular sulfur oxidation DsrE/DsrF family protein
MKRLAMSLLTVGLVAGLAVGLSCPLDARAATPAPAASSAADPVAPAAPGEERAVYHVDDMASARDALNNMANHLKASPQARLALVANGRGIFMLVAGEKDRHGDYASAITALEAQGVRFFACRNSMNVNNIDASTLVTGVQTVPAGVSALARLQGVEHYAYIKP